MKAMKARLALPPDCRAPSGRKPPRVHAIVLPEHGVRLRDPETGTAVTIAPIEFVREP
jgi:hypothetical protein